MDPFKILIAEIMLQKTVASNVKKVFPRFIERFPSPKDILEAPIEEIEQELRPLGIFRRRAKAIKQIAAEVISKYDGKVPSHKEAIAAFPMVGDYVANAVMCFGFGKDIPLVDVNVKRVMKRFFGLTKLHEIEKKLREVIPKGKSKEMNWALIDFASIICIPGKPKCHACPLSADCRKNFDD